MLNITSETMCLTNITSKQYSLIIMSHRNNVLNITSETIRLTNITSHRNNVPNITLKQCA